MGNLAGKIALVTGAGTGIGQGIAVALAERGARVAVHYHSSADGAKETLRRIGAIGGDAFIVQGNVANKDEIDRMTAAVADRYGGIDILVNNAALQLNRDLPDYTPEDFDRVMNVNLKGYWQCIQSALPYMKNRPNGRVILISSVHAKRPTDFDPVYAMSKGGIKMLAREAAIELARYGITVNVVEPGAVLVARTAPKQTEMTEEERKAFEARFRKKFPLGRIGLPKDVASLVCYIASDETEYLSGAAIRLDGANMLL
jgi:glucose 1-dehydrogenase